MNKKLEETFNLPSMEEALENDKDNENGPENDSSSDEGMGSQDLEQDQVDSENSDEQDHSDIQVSPDKVKEALSVAQRIDNALPQVKDLESHDMDMDSYAKDAMQSYKDLMDLGRNSETRFSGKLFEVASNMMKNAVEAKNAKADKKLRMIELQLKKQRVDQMGGKAYNKDEIIEGEGYVMGDRNELLDKLAEKVKQQENGDDK